MANRYKRRRKNRLAAPIGGAFFLLAVIGVVTIIITSLRLTQQVLDNKSQKESFEQLIRPVVMFDPVPFETAENISNTSLLLYCMWSALSSERSKNYVLAENQELLVPASDLDVAAHILFGGVASLEHGTFGDFEVQYYYDSEKKMYSVPMLAELFVYTPRVTDIAKDGDFYNLTVEYIPPGSAWTAALGGNTQEPQPDKTMIYVMNKQKDGWHIIKVRDLPVDPNNPQPVNRS